MMNIGNFFDLGNRMAVGSALFVVYFVHYAFLALA